MWEKFKMVPWWRISFKQQELNRMIESFNNQNISQGKVTRSFEENLEDYLQVKNVIAVSSGSSALLISLMAIEIQPGDEVIIPDRTWIATAHAIKILGAHPVICDVENDKPIIKTNRIIELITNKTKAIIPVHLNGRSANLKEINNIAKKYQLHVIEDAAQALGSRNLNGMLGTQSEIGCYSFSVAKTISTGQGGIVVTNDNNLANKIRNLRTHGVENVKDPKEWRFLGFNFRFTDILASIGIEQLKRIDQAIINLKLIYKFYEDSLTNSDFSLIEVDIDNGEVPVYSEFLVENRDLVIKKLLKNKIETRPFYPSMSEAKYLKSKSMINSSTFSKKGIYLPSGPNQSFEDIKKCIEIINSL